MVRLNLDKLRRFKHHPNKQETIARWKKGSLLDGLEGYVYAPYIPMGITYAEDYSDKYMNRKLVDKVQFVGGL